MTCNDAVLLPCSSLSLPRFLPRISLKPSKVLGKNRMRMLAGHLTLPRKAKSERGADAKMVFVIASILLDCNNFVARSPDPDRDLDHKP
jgi:hypothetical protein